MNASNPREEKTPKSSPFAHEFGRRIKGKITTRGSSIQPPPNLKENGLESVPRKLPRKDSKNHQKRKTRENTKALRNHTKSSIHTMKVHTRSSLPPDHPSLSQDLTMKLSS
jgi:hypothetical protein